MTAPDLDRLIRLEEFLRQESQQEQTKIIFEWRDCDSSGKEKDKVGDGSDAGTTPAEEED